MKTINRLNVAEHLLEYQLSLIGKTTFDALKDDMWIFNWTLSPEKYEQLRNYSIKILKKVFKFNKTKAEETFSWWHLQFGLKIKSL